MTAKRKRLATLAAGRPPTARRQQSITRKTTKALINKHHQLQKKKQKAQAIGDVNTVCFIDAQIQAMGGLKRYQQASLQGQRDDRGGDTSRVLMQWLGSAAYSFEMEAGRRPRMLEVGALSVDNSCSKAGCFDMERIDLHSQGEGIKQEDFMLRPVPQDHDTAHRFDIISLSLVLNYVPDAAERGAMLRRTLFFLCEHGTTRQDGTGRFFPSVFLVLPAPCVTNSRYLNEERLEAIMHSLGFLKVLSKTTLHLVYYLWKKDASAESCRHFPKKEVRAGASRNNFAVILKSDTHGPGPGLSPTS